MTPCSSQHSASLNASWLAQSGEFFPYAVVVLSEGQTEMVTATPDIADGQPASADVLAACRTILTERRDQLRATAVVADVHLSEGGDAIQVELEHSGGPALTVLLPYTKKRLGRGIDYGQLRAASGTRRVWLA